MTTCGKYVIFVLWIFTGLLLANDNRTVIHPHISFHNSATNENAVAFNGDKIYLATKFYGHIYEYNYMADSSYFVDKFKLREKDSNKSAAGAMVCHLNFLYTATTYSFQRLPEIYIFNTDSPGEKVLPVAIINLLGYDPTLLAFYNPQVIGNYIYWGTYHSQAGVARLVRLDISDHNYVKEDIALIHSAEDDAPKTYSLARLKDILYVSTNTGKILRFKLNLQTGAISSELKPIDMNIDARSQEIQHLKADQRSNILWANTTLENSLFCITNPEESYTIVRTANRIVNTRIYTGPDGFLYGQGRDPENRNIIGYRIRKTETGFDYQVVPGLANADFGVILGGGINSQGIPYLIGEDFRRADQNPAYKHIRTLNLISHQQRQKTVKAIEIHTVGLTLNALASDNLGELYLSTYQAGYMYKINTDFNEKDFLPPGRLRYTYQADIITSYSRIPGSMLFGIYGGTGISSRLIFYDALTGGNPWKHWILPEGPQGIVYERLKAIAVDPGTQDVYIGTSNHLLDSKAYPAKIFRLREKNLKGPEGKIEDWEEIAYQWPQDPDRYDHPDDFLAMASDGTYLYCLTQHYDKKNNIRENRFCRLKTGGSRPLIHPGDIKTEQTYSSWSTHCDKAICIDGKRLLVGYGPKLFLYDLDRFDINQPDSTYNLGNEIIVAILSDSEHYYLCQPHLISIFGKDLIIKHTIRPPDEDVEDDYFETISLNDGDG